MSALTPRQLSLVKEKILNQPPDENWFKTLFMQPFRIEQLPLSDVCEAFDRSEQTFRQFPVDTKRVSALCKEIFHKDAALYEPIVLGELNSLLYGIGGRHRCHAILQVLQSLDLDGHIKEPEIPCLVYSFKSRAELVRAIELDNKSRPMHSAELSSLHAQFLGVDLDNFDSVHEVLRDTKSRRDESIIFANTFRMALTLEATNSLGERKVLSPDTLLSLGRTVGYYLENFRVPRPAPPRQGRYADLNLLDRDLAVWAERFTVPETQKLSLKPEQKLGLLEWFQTRIQEFLDANPLKGTLIARELLKSDYLHGLMMYLHDAPSTDGIPLHQYLENLSEANEQERKAQARKSRSESKSKQIVSLFSEALAGLDLSGLSPEQIAELLQNVMSQS